jgi:hypothetical protein
MTDALAERFAALSDLRDDSDWLDVRRRARRRVRLAVPVAAAAAAVVAASAFAASSGWVFSSHNRQVTARTDVVVAGRTWHVSYATSTARHAVFCARASSSGAANRSKCTEMGPGSPHFGPPLGGMKLVVPGGQIWAGATVGFARRIAITDAAGHTYVARAVRAPKGTKTPFRYWVIVLGSSPAHTITSYGSNGRKLTTTLR